MKQTTFQLPEIRDANDSIIQAGTYGKESPLVNSTNDGVLDYINNNLMYLYNNTMGGTGGEINTETITGKTGTITNLTATTVKAGTLTADALNGPLTGNVTGDVTGNVTGDVTGNLTGNVNGNVNGDVTGNVTGTADKAVADGSGNNIVNTYVTKSALASSVTTATGKVTTLTATNSTLTNVTITGTTSVPTANAGNSSKAIANTEFVSKSISALVNGAPDQLNTLNELAKALGNDSNFAATVTAELAKKLNSTEAESTYATKQEARVLPGTVTAFSGTFKDGYPIDKNTGLVNKEWHLCDGTNGTPDLRNRFIFGGDGTNNGTTGGEASVTLIKENIPAHSHNFYLDTTKNGTAKDNAWLVDAGTKGATKGLLRTTEPTGGNQPHNNMPPYFVLAFIMKL
ncbi:hypothetical protein [Acidaminococcus timonensis]|uniref:hypothetical protein n=1 Tax=Acidaminococcus timonensis TaxID=1871002 RepID=UPI0008DAFB98|nr:hypothetical protein [Acidaminococcus timonensis]